MGSLPHLPGRPAGLPELFQVRHVSQGVHRLPKAMMLKGCQLPLFSQALERVLLPERLIVGDVVDHIWGQHKETTVNHAAIALGFFSKAVDLVSCHVEGTKATRWNSRSQSGLNVLCLVERNELGDVYVTHAIPVGEAKNVLVLEVGRHTLQPSTGHGVVTGIDQGDLPWLRIALVNFHHILLHIEGYIGCVEEVVGEVLLDYVTLVATANNEVVDAVGGVGLHNVPEDGLAADLDHRLGLEVGLL